MTHYVYNTLANDQRYTERGKNRTVVASVFIAGKANIPNKHMLTSRGVVTEVTDEQLAILRNNAIFKLHEKNGFITVERRKVNADKVADSMNNNDPSAPDTEAKLAAEGAETPATAPADGKPKRGSNK